MDKKLRSDILLLIGLLLAAGILYLLCRPGETGSWVVVTLDGQETARYALNEDITVTLGGTAYNVLEIAHHTAAITDANCGDHTCIHTGAIHRDGETIVCLPHHLMIYIEGGDTALTDGVVG